MAIEKMKKLQIIAPASQREELMRKLLLLGCVELREQDALLDDPETAALVSRAAGDVTASNQERMKALFASQVSKASGIFSFRLESLESEDGSLPLLPASALFGEQAYEAGRRGDLPPRRVKPNRESRKELSQSTVSF